MPRNQIVLTAFVASPGDVADERALLEEIIKELNDTWSRNLGLRIELVRWETHTFPAVGAHPQAVINQQIGDDYDIFIGIMWKRFGTRTLDHESGTQEEFERAFTRFKEKSESIQIMFYFKDAPVIPSETDFSQMAKVIEFKKHLGEEGTYHWKFKSRDEFAQFVRVHLSRVAQMWTAKNTGSQATTVPRVTPSGSSITESLASAGDDATDELGFLDHIELGEQSLARSRECMERMLQATNAIGEAIHKRTAEVNALNPPDGTFNLQAAKKVGTMMADNLLNFVSRMNAEIPIFSGNHKAAVDHITQAADLLVQDFTADRTHLVGAREGLNVHVLALASLEENVADFRDAMVKWPRVQTVLNRAKRKTIEVLEHLLRELAFIKQVTADAVRLLDELIAKLDAASSIKS